MNNTLLKWDQLGWLRVMEEDGKEEEGDCQPPQKRQIILMGSGKTDIHGHWSLKVPNVLCPAPHLNDVDWVSMVATPSKFYGQNPEENFFPPLEAELVTTGWSVNNGILTLHVKSRQPNGEPKQLVYFSYHAAIIDYPDEEPQ
jgi:hypothetical protein